MTMQQYCGRGAVKELVTGDVFRERLQRLVETAKPQDTVVIYTHSHGCRNGFEAIAATRRYCHRPAYKTIATRRYDAVGRIR